MIHLGNSLSDHSIPVHQPALDREVNHGKISTLIAGPRLASTCTRAKISIVNTS